VDRPVTAGHAIPVKEFVEQLTEREYIVLALLPTRLSNTEIADRLGVSLNTIKTHLKHIYRKFDVVGRRDAVDTAERLRLL
jgi:LuxR family maltose regulon positive regulatory protein